MKRQLATHQDTESVTIEETTEENDTRVIPSHDKENGGDSSLEARYCSSTTLLYLNQS